MRKHNLCKAVFLGESFVGKTTLIKAYFQEKKIQAYKATLGADFSSKEIIIAGKLINLEVWDTAGQERFRSLGPMFYQNSDACILVYDITDHKSFETIESWRQQFIEKSGINNAEDFPFFLIGNKTDLQNSRKVSKIEVQSYLAQKKNIVHLEVSALDPTSVNNIFQIVAQRAAFRCKDQKIFIPMKLTSVKERQRAKNPLCC